MAFARDDQAARLEGYEPLDLHKSGDACFALRVHHIDPEEDTCSPAEVVEEVLKSSRLQGAIIEVCVCGHGLASSLCRLTPVG